MSLQWTLVATFLYCEIAVTILLLLPFVSVTLWQKIFKSRLLQSLASYANLYFFAFIVILLLLFLDSIREARKYSLDKIHDEHAHLDTELKHRMQVFRAQRNCFVSGFALFLAPVIYRLAGLISQQATMKASCEASLKQAKSASDMANRLMKEKEKAEQEGGILKENEGNAQRAEYESKLQAMQDRLKEVEKELSSTKLDLKTVKQQAEGTNREYDRLLAEHGKLQEQFAKCSGDSESKKDE